MRGRESVRWASVSQRRPDGYRDWPMKCSTEETFRIKIGCAFFATFFAQAKKVEQFHNWQSDRSVILSFCRNKRKPLIDVRQKST